MSSDADVVLGYRGRTVTPGIHRLSGTTSTTGVTKMAGKRLWRYSPLALCPCYNIDKKYVDCCWLGNRPKYHNDKTGTLRQVTRATGENAARSAQFILGGGLGQVKEMCELQSKAMRGPMGRQFMTQLAMSCVCPNKSSFTHYDPDVYAGTIETMDEIKPGSSFHWNNLH
jgi:hypothetical protein